jgi:hypothetical protein
VQQWQFGQTLDSRWYWRKLCEDRTFVQSACNFDTRMQCVADAFANGYLSPPAGQSIFLPSDLPEHLRTASAP